MLHCTDKKGKNKDWKLSIFIQTHQFASHKITIQLNSTLKHIIPNIRWDKTRILFHFIRTEYSEGLKWQLNGLTRKIAIIRIWKFMLVNEGIEKKTLVSFIFFSSSYFYIRRRLRLWRIDHFAESIGASMIKTLIY